MNLLQIGESVSKFSEEYINTSKDEMNWRAIKGMRNLFAHAYDSMDLDKIWETAVDDIPVLEEYCINILQNQNNSLDTDFDGMSMSM